MTPREFLEHTLDGNDPTAADLDSLLASIRTETDVIELKSGQELADKAKAAQTLKEQVSAFANGLGGIVVFGVADATHKVDGCPSVGSGTLGDWASRVLQNLGSLLSPSPRVFSIAHPDGDVLLVVVARNDNLVSVIHKGAMRYFLRIGESTVQAPEHLVSDLLTGRRAKPGLVARGHINPQLHTHSADSAIIHVYVTISNDSLVAAHELAFGAISVASSTDVGSVRASEFLRHWLNVSLAPGQLLLQHLVPTRVRVLHAFQALAETQVVVPIPSSPDDRQICAAFYLGASNAPPVWYQVCARILGDRLVDPLTFEKASGRAEVFSRAL